MKADNIKKMVSILSKTEWTSSQELAKMIHVDKRTIKNYVNEINKDGITLIEASTNGYRLKDTTTPTMIQSLDYIGERTNTVLNFLLTNKDGISIFTLSEELCVSESTIMNDITKKLKQLLKNFDIDIVSHNYTLSLKGSEQNKRKLIGFIATNNSNGYFSSLETLNKLFPKVRIEDISNILLEFCDQSGLFINTYALNNLLVHLVIIFIRIQSDNTLSETTTICSFDALLANSKRKDQILGFANKIVEFYRNTCHQEMPINDFNQIVLLVSLSVEEFHNGEINIDEFTNYIDKELFHYVVSIILDMNERYNLPETDNDFLYQFSLHIYNLYQRAIYQISYPNPLISQIKKEHAPVYDMAVYFAHRLTQKFNIVISEDEIGFIAFHLGSNLEKQVAKDKVFCIVVTEDYHFLRKNLLHELHLAFNDDLSLVDVLSPMEYSTKKYHVDLIISTVDYKFEHSSVVLVNPIITEKNIRNIHNEIMKIKQHRKTRETISFLNYMFNEMLFFRNVNKESAEDYIRMLGDYCIKQGLIDDMFIKDVLDRESFSSTAFTDYIAVPHSISCYAKKSFICVLHNDAPISWKGKHINFIFLIGIADGDMTYFRDVFNIIVESFSSNEQSLKFLKTNTFAEFMEVLTPKND